MPCLVSSYVQGAAWKIAEIGRELTKFLAEKGIIMVSWISQAGGCATRAQKLVGPGCDPRKVLQMRLESGPMCAAPILWTAGC